MAYVRIDMDDIETEDLVEELEDRGYTVSDPGEVSANVETIKDMEDDIYNLYRDFIDWDEFGKSDGDFAAILKRFFEKHTDKIVA